jgi:hypothetical protein
MNLLLDTHSWLWFVLGDPQLSAVGRSHILDSANVKFVSPASYSRGSSPSVVNLTVRSRGAPGG